MTLKLYHCPRTRSIRIMWALEELGLDYEIEPVPFDRAWFRSPEWRAVSPLGKVPVFYDGEERLVESVAVIHYLAEKHAEGKLARRPADSDYGQFLQWLHFGEAGMGPYVTMLIAQTRLLPPEQRLEPMKQWAIAETKNCCAFIEQSLEGKQFILGDEFSLADISLGYALYLVKISGEAENILGPRTQEYFARLAARPAWKKASAA